MDIVYAKRQSSYPGQEWFTVYTAYTAGAAQMYYGIAFHFSNGLPRGESFDLAVGTLERPPGGRC
jgi:hypothetical protein